MFECSCFFCCFCGGFCFVYNLGCGWLIEINVFCVCWDWMDWWVNCCVRWVNILLIFWVCVCVDGEVMFFFFFLYVGFWFGDGVSVCVIVCGWWLRVLGLEVGGGDLRCIEVVVVLVLVVRFWFLWLVMGDFGKGDLVGLCVVVLYCVRCDVLDWLVVCNCVYWWLFVVWWWSCLLLFCNCV